jgi:hypothetical protein
VKQVTNFGIGRSPSKFFQHTHKNYPLTICGSCKVREWLVLLTPDVEKAREMAGELAEAVGAEAEVLAVPFLERQLS